MPQRNAAPAKTASATRGERLAAEKRREAQRQARLEAAQRREERRERRRRLFRISLSISLVFVALYWIFVSVTISRRGDLANQDALPLLIFQEGQRKEDTRLEAQEVFFRGTNYLPVTFLEPYMAISQFGDYQTRSFLLSDSGEYATFYLGSCNAIVNGERVSLKSEVFLKDDVLYLPVDFYTDKMNCFTFTHSSPLSANTLTLKTSVTPAFCFHSATPSAPVDPASAPQAPAEPVED